MLQISNLHKRYGSETVLAAVSFTLSAGERVALVGPNGSGKSTLLRLITGEESPDSGQFRVAGRLGYLPQALAFTPEETVAAVLQRLNTEHQQAWEAMQRLAAQMATATDEAQLASLTEAYAAAETRFELAGGYTLDARIEAVLAGLSLADLPREIAVAGLSGGQKTRLGLARLLIQQPQLLLLDEPTNHLDLAALDWLAAWLTEYDGAVLIVSHDRDFLNATTTRTLILDAETHTLRDFAGNYSAYEATREREIAQQWQAYKDQQAEISRLRGAAAHLRGEAQFRRGGKADTNDKFAKEHFGNRSAATVGRAKQLERRIEALLTDEQIEKPTRHWHLRLDFDEADSGGRQVLALDRVSVTLGERSLFAPISLTVMHGQRICLVGPNGVGKTTLLRVITGELAPTAGTVRLGAGIQAGYLAQEQEILDLTQTPYQTIAATGLSPNETYHLLHKHLFSGDEVNLPLTALSFGQRTRLMLALMVAQGCNFLLLDEPLNHLDLESRHYFEQALLNFPGTVLAISHDRAFVRHVATEVWLFEAGQIRRVVDIATVTNKEATP